MTKKKAVSIVSGGPDSTGYAAIWKSRGYTIYPVIFKYGQKGIKEVEVAQELCRKLGFEEPLVLDISFMAKLWRGSQLTDESVRVEEEYKPTVIVPLRNAVFLTIATAYAMNIGASIVTYGAHLDDVKLTPEGEPCYPDCHPAFAVALETALNLGHIPTYRRKVEIWCPAREGWSKAENLRRAYQVMGDLIFETWSCYVSGPVHCGRCQSCRDRKRAFKEAGIPDKTVYAE